VQRESRMGLCNKMNVTANLLRYKYLIGGDIP